MGQRHDGLDGHRMEYGGRYVLAVDILGYQILNVRLAEHAAAGSYGIHLRGTQRKLVQLPDADTQDDGHLVNKRAGTPRTVSVHAQIRRFALVEEHDFGILAADVYHGTDAGIVFADGFGGSHDFLDKGEFLLFRNAHAHGTRYLDTSIDIAKLSDNLFQDAAHDLLGSCIMSFIFGIYNLICCIQRNQFCGCRTYIYTNLKHIINLMCNLSDIFVKCKSTQISITETAAGSYI